MKQEDKQLLLQDLCARIPYGVKIFYSTTVPIAELKTINTEKGICIAYDCSQWYRHSKWHIENIKPYLRSMSSMTEEEEEEFVSFTDTMFRYGKDNNLCCFPLDAIDWLNKNHFDYRGLIEKGLALEAPEGMYNIKE